MKSRKFPQGKGEQELAGMKTDPRIRRTKAAIREAFVRLMQKKEYDAITVTDVSEEAQINRKTFYAHYETKEQLFAQILGEMFYDLLSAFMYEKAVPDANLDIDVLSRDIESFFSKIEAYREELDTLIGGRTIEMAFEIADDVIRSTLKKIHVLEGEEEGTIPAALYVSRIKNFFFTSIDWWLEQENRVPGEAAKIYCKLMRMSTVNMFRYQQMQSVTEK